MTVTRHGFCTDGVAYADEALQQFSMLFVIPVTEEDSELLVVLVCFAGRMQDEGSTKSVDILTLRGHQLCRWVIVRYAYV